MDHFVSCVWLTRFWQDSGKISLVHLAVKTDLVEIKSKKKKISILLKKKH